MVFNINPVADVVPLAINRKIFSVFDIGNHKRQQFFRELERPVVVGTVGQGNRQTVSVVVSHYNVVAGGL